MTPMTSSPETDCGPLHPIAASRAAAPARTSRRRNWKLIGCQDRAGDEHYARLPRRGWLLLDGYSNGASPLSPGAVVVANVAVAEKLVKHEPGMCRALADAAVGDHLAVARDALAGVDLPQL